MYLLYHLRGRNQAIPRYFRSLLSSLLPFFASLIGNNVLLLVLALGRMRRSAALCLGLLVVLEKHDADRKIEHDVQDKGNPVLALDVIGGVAESAERHDRHESDHNHKQHVLVRIFHISIIFGF